MADYRTFYLPVSSAGLLDGDMARRELMSAALETRRCTWRAVHSRKACLSLDDTRRWLCYWRDTIGAPIVFWADGMLSASRLFAEFFVLFVLAYIFGIA